MMVNVDAVPNVYIFPVFLIHRISEFSMNFLLDVFRDLWFPPLSFCDMHDEKLKRSPQRLSALTVPLSHAGCVFAPALTRHHPSCFKGVKWNFSQHKWGEMMQNSNPFKDGMFQKPRTKHPMNYDEDIDSWKMVKIPRLQVGSKEIGFKNM